MFLSLSHSGTFERVSDFEAIGKFGSLYVRKTHERASFISQWYARSAFSEMFGDCIAIPSRRGTSFYLVHMEELLFTSRNIFPALEVIPRASGILEIYVLAVDGSPLECFAENFTYLNFPSLEGQRI